MRAFSCAANYKNDALVFAGIRYRRVGEEHWSKGVFANLTILRDMSDVIALNNLAIDTDYEYQAGWFSPMSPVHTVETIQELPLQWPREIYRFRTQSSKTTTPRAYIVGSCRYLRMTAGIASAPHLGDRIFASITSLAERAEPPISAMLMTGDQIYVDDLNLVAPPTGNTRTSSANTARLFFSAAHLEVNVRHADLHDPR